MLKTVRTAFFSLYSLHSSLIFYTFPSPFFYFIFFISPHFIYLPFYSFLPHCPLSLHSLSTHTPLTSPPSLHQFLHSTMDSDGGGDGGKDCVFEGSLRVFNSKEQLLSFDKKTCLEAHASEVLMLRVVAVVVCCCVLLSLLYVFACCCRCCMLLYVVAVVICCCMLFLLFVIVIPLLLFGVGCCVLLLLPLLLLVLLCVLHVFVACCYQILSTSCWRGF